MMMITNMHKIEDTNFFLPIRRHVSSTWNITAPWLVTESSTQIPICTLITVDHQENQKTCKEYKSYSACNKKEKFLRHPVYYTYSWCLPPVSSSERYKDIYLWQKNDIEISKNIACERPLWGTLGAGQEKEGQLATTSLEFEFHLQFPSGFPSTELSEFCQSVRSRNKHECKQRNVMLWVMTSLLVSSLPININYFRINFFNPDI